MDGDTRSTITGGIFFNTVIQGRTINVTLPSEIIPAMTGLPPATPTFIGRTDALGTLLDALAPPQNPSAPVADQDLPTATLVTAAVSGMGGIGKTELAVKAARIALDNGWFPGGVLFVDMRGYDRDPALRIGPGQALEGFLHAIGVAGDQVPMAVQERSRLLRSVLATYAAEGRRVLVVADNVSTSAQADPLLPSDGVCAAIVTSRHVLADLDTRLLNLKSLSTDQAVDLLDAALLLRDPADTRIRDYPDDAERLAGVCAGLPLALKIVAAQLAANTAKPLAAMATDLDDAESRLKEMAFADRAVHAAFDASYHQLPEEQARLFRLLSLNPGPDISAPTAAALTGLDEAEARRGLEALAYANLIEPGTTYGRWRMHDLVRLHSAHHGLGQADTDQRPNALARLLGHYLVTARAADAHLDASVTAPASHGFSDREQALAWLDAEYLNLTAVVSTCVTLAGHQAIARDLPQAIWHFLEWRRYFNDWIGLSKASLTAAGALDDSIGKGNALNSLGVALREAGRVKEAISAHEDAVQIFQAAKSLQREGAARDNLGNDLREARRTDEAIAAIRRAVQIHRSTGNRHRESQALGNLGITLSDVGRWEEAITAHQQGLKISRETADLYGEGIALDNLGATLGEVGRWQEAITAHQQATQIHHTTGNRHGEGKALSNLAIALRQAGQWEEAIIALNNAVQIFHDLKDDHSEGLMLFILSDALIQVERWENAIEICQQATYLLRAANDHPNEASTLSNLGFSLRQVGRYEEAITAYQTAAQIFHEFGDDHNETTARSNLQETLRARGAAVDKSPG